MPLLSAVWYKMPRETWAWRKGFTGHKTPTAFHDVPVITTTTLRNCSLPLLRNGGHTHCIQAMAGYGMIRMGDRLLAALGCLCAETLLQLTRNTEYVQ
jgi:hypothetical protein